MKALAYSLVFLLVISAQSGPLIATLCFTQCTALCVPLGFPPAIAVCIAGCIATCSASGIISCFNDDTVAITPKGNKLISELSKGDLVKTISMGKEGWTRIAQLIITESQQKFVKLRTQSKELSVTHDHVMLVGQRLMKANQMEIGMKINGEAIISLEHFIKNKKITVITQTGTILANGLLTTTICGDYIDVHGTNLEVLEKWRMDHNWLMVQ